jgi:hypothetical protein
MGFKDLRSITSKLAIPDMKFLHRKNFSELRNLALFQIKWNKYLSNIGLTLFDGQSINFETTTYTQIYVCNPNKKITKVECIIHEDESRIIRINFYSGQETLVQAGGDDDDVEEDGGRVETFEISPDEQLIGCEITHC